MGSARVAIQRSMVSGDEVVGMGGGEQVGAFPSPERRAGETGGGHGLLHQSIRMNG